MAKKNEPEKKADRLEKAYGKFERPLYSWERYDERELFHVIAKRAKAYLQAYEEWMKE
jgi:hypothetical protein